MTRPTNALIVDDEPHVRAYLRLLLRELGIERVWEADEGSQGLAMIEQHKPHLVLLDVNMPVMDGLQALERIAQTHPETPVIVVTSQSATPTVHAAHRLGAVGYLLKHSPRVEALATLREAIAGMEDEPAEDSDEVEKA